MSSISKVVVVQHDPRTASAVRLGFEREGATVVTADDAGAVDDDTALVVAGAEGAEPARALLGLLAAKGAPVLWVGNGVRREEAWAAGADEVLPQPSFLRDVVTIGKLLAGRKRGHRTTFNGDLGDYFGVFYMVRALAATGRSGVLTLVRGLRRGEMRLFEGEVTSAHMGGMHGQAGFHQLLLWTEARFEWRHERVVRRQQIPMPHEEVLGQAEKFLHEIRVVSGGLSPAAVYEQDGAKIQAMARKLPTEVHGVLRLFDGNRTLADVLEDSSFRVFETLRVALRAVETGLLKQVEVAKPKAAMRAVLAVEEWLVGGESKDAVIDRTMESIPDSAPHPKVPPQEVGSAGTGGKKKNKGKKKRGGKDSGPSRALAPEVDWSSLVPRSQSVDMSAVTGVVPAAEMSGEIVIGEQGGAIAARREGREGLEALTDAEERSRMFPASVTVDLGPDPSLQAEPAGGDQTPPAQPVATTPTPSPGHAPALAPVVAAAIAPEPAVLTLPRVVTQESLEDAVAAAVVVHAKAIHTPEIPGTPKPQPELPGPAVDPEPEIVPPEPRQPEIPDPELPKPEAPRSPEPPAEPEAERPEPTEPIPKEELESPVEVSPELTAPPVAPPAAEPMPAEPAMLAVDLAFAQAAVAVVAEREASRSSKKPPRDTHDPGTSAEISAVRLDAVAAAASFSDDEEAFFNAGKTLEQARKVPSTESFADLDEGYQPETFWSRLRGKKDTKKP